MCSIDRERRGFTLIELLVVVLIIGILASVALPQYNKAVTKARITEAWSFIDAAEKAMELYLLEQDGYPNETKNLMNGLEKELSIDMTSFGALASGLQFSSGNWSGHIEILSDGWNVYLVSNKSSAYIYDTHPKNSAANKYCQYNENKGKEICEAFVSGRPGWTAIKS